MVELNVAAFVSGNGVKASGQGKEQKLEEGILEADGGEIEIGAGARGCEGILSWRGRVGAPVEDPA